MSSHIVTRQSLSPKEPHIVETDTSGHDASRPDTSQQEPSAEDDKTQIDTSRHVGALDIFEHPYVKKLEGQVEKWEGKYHEQVRRTEDIQIRSQEKLLELQRMVTIGQNKTLADFMLQAKEWFLGPGAGSTEKTGTTDASGA
jgi:hypothetical protein